MLRSFRLSKSSLYECRACGWWSGCAESAEFSMTRCGFMGLGRATLSRPVCGWNLSQGRSAICGADDSDVGSWSAC